MKKLIVICIMLLLAVGAQAQTIGSTKTETYQADFEKKQSINLVANYDDTIVIPIQVLKIGIKKSLNQQIHQYGMKMKGF